MAIDVIQLPPDSTGKKVAARSYTEGAQTVYAQAGYLTTDTALGNPAVVTNAIPGETDYALVTRSFTTGAPFTVQTPASLTASAQSATATALDRAGNIMVTVKGTYGFTTTPPTYIFEGSDDAGTSWFPIVAVREDIAIREQTGTLPANTTRSWTIDTTGWTQVRFRLTAWGTPTGAIVTRWSPGATPYEPNVTDVPMVRTNVSFTSVAAAGVTSEALLSLTPVRGGTAGGAATTHAITTGKRLRLTGFYGSVRSAAAASAWTRWAVRTNPTGAVLVTSPVIWVGEAGTPAAVSGSTWATGPVYFPDGGFEFLGAEQIGISHIGQATTNVNSVSLFGYEY